MRFASTLPLFALIAAPSALLAQTQEQKAVVVDSKIQAVKEVVDAKGVKKLTLVDPSTILPGTPIVIWLNYRNTAAKPVTNFVITNPINAATQFTGFGANSGWGLVSVDGGKTFGALTAFKVTRQDKTTRPAIALDVTHLRWTLPRPIAAGGTGTLSFYAVVK
jgi:hypothetical protein